MKNKTKNILNWILWILGIIAVGILLYGIIKILLK
jgi:hypothetical protein